MSKKYIRIVVYHIRSTVTLGIRRFPYGPYILSSQYKTVGFDLHTHLLLSIANEIIGICCFKCGSIIFYYNKNVLRNLCEALNDDYHIMFKYKNLMRKLASLIASYREEGTKLMYYQKGQNPMKNNISMKSLSSNK